MKLYTVFLDGQLYKAADTWLPVVDMPDGVYFRYAPSPRNVNWYVKRHDNATPINLSDVPKEIRMLLLLIT